MSLSKKRAEMEQVNPSLQNTEKRHRKDSLILERSFFPFWSLENIPSWHNLERGTELRSSTGRATIHWCVLYTRFTKYFRNYGEHHYARRNPENKKRPFKRAEAKNCGWIYRNAGQHHGNHTWTCDHPYWRTRAGRYRQSGETTVWLTPSRSRYFFYPAPRTKSDPEKSVDSPSYIGRSKLHS